MKEHVKKRFFQRFGFELTDNMLDSVISQIRKQKSVFLEKQTNTRSVHLVEVSGKKVVVVYNSERKLIHTCFPLSWYNSEIYRKKMKIREYINRGDVIWAHRRGNFEK